MRREDNEVDEGDEDNEVNSVDEVNEIDENDVAKCPRASDQGLIAASSSSRIPTNNGTL